MNFCIGSHLARAFPSLVVVVISVGLPATSAGQYRQKPGHEYRWFGKLPACGGNANDCREWFGTLVHRERCRGLFASGHKVLCERPLKPGMEYREFGAGPHCEGKQSDCTAWGGQVIFTHRRKCSSGSGARIRCERRRFVKDPNKEYETFGKLPTCGGTASDCREWFGTVAYRDSAGCTTGTRVICERPRRSGMEYREFGAGPHCNATAEDCTRWGGKPIFQHRRLCIDGDGARVRCERPRFVADPNYDYKWFGTRPSCGGDAADCCEWGGGEVAYYDSAGCVGGQLTGRSERVLCKRRKKPGATCKIAAPSGTRIFSSQPLNHRGRPLRGFVDLHTHLMSHLGFGGLLMHGAPGVGVLMPKNMRGCSKPARTASSITEALPPCTSTHGTGDLGRVIVGCGNAVRAEAIRQLETEQGAVDRHSGDVGGANAYACWPRHNSITHQLMYDDWIKRAWQGGMRVMVALVANSETLAKTLATGWTDGPNAKQLSDPTAIDLQIAETTRFVRAPGREFMEIARSSQELKDIVERDHLAVVLGIEIDDFGGFMRKGKMKPSAQEVRDEVTRLHRLGVRYVFPVHLTDNVLGGTAPYLPLFNYANREHFGNWWDLKCADSASGVTKVLKGPRSSFIFDLVRDLRHGIGAPPPPRADCRGHANRRDLQPAGVIALQEMMGLGMLIDTDHMSDATFDETVDIARAWRGGYPLLSGHTNLRAGDEASEATRSYEQYATLADLGGMAGIGWNGLDAPGYLQRLKKVWGNARTNKRLHLALGSDINGLVMQPRPPTGSKLERGLPRFQSGTRQWCYNEDGVANIGLFPDFLAHIEELKGGKDMVEELFDGAENFLRMWEKAEGRTRTADATMTARSRRELRKRRLRPKRRKSRLIR